ncbi:MAG: mechanosensitive ion channel domain-containing protein [Geitlerinemataceae cyanobacterium]
MISSIVITAIEIGILVILFALMYGIVNMVFRSIASSALKDKKSRVVRYRRQVGLILLLVCTVLCLCVLGINGYIISQGKSVFEVQMNLVPAISKDFWISLLVSLVKCILLVLLVKLGLSAIRSLLQSIRQAARNYDKIKGNDGSIDLFFDFLSQTISTSFWIEAAILCATFFKVQKNIISFSYWCLGTYLFVRLGLLFVKVIPIIVDTLDDLSLKFSNTYKFLKYYEKFRYLIPTFKRLLELLIYLGTASIIFQYTAPINWLSQYVYQAISIISVYFFVRLSIAVANVVVDEFVRHAEGLTDTQKQRRLTIAPLFKNLLKYTTYFGALVAVLEIIKIDPGPILASAGILGVAIGFGAQNLVEDIVSGFLILFENYYLVGDYIEAGRVEERSIQGIVEAIELRTTQVRHPDGQLQIVRNGEIGSVINYSKQYIYAKVDIPLAYETSLEETYSTVEEVGQKLKLKHSDIVIKPTQIEGLESFGKSLVLVRTITKVKPGQHLYIQRELRRMLKDAFDRSNLELSDYEPETNSD